MNHILQQLIKTRMGLGNSATGGGRVGLRPPGCSAAGLQLPACTAAAPQRPACPALARWRRPGAARARTATAARTRTAAVKRPRGSGRLPGTAPRRRRRRRGRSRAAVRAADRLGSFPAAACPPLSSPPRRSGPAPSAAPPDPRGFVSAAVPGSGLEAALPRPCPASSRALSPFPAVLARGEFPFPLIIVLPRSGPGLSFRHYSLCSDMCQTGVKGVLATGSLNVLLSFQGALERIGCSLKMSQA